MKRISHKVLLMSGAVAALFGLGAIAAADTWTNVGTQSIDWTESGNSNLPRFISPGTRVIFYVVSIVENDTLTPTSGAPRQVDDPMKEARLRKTGGTVAGNWTQTFTGPGFYTYTVPGTATAGQTITITGDLHDTRANDDPRHDDWNVIKTWNFTVSTDCPESLSVDAMTDISGARPTAGNTYGSWRATMLANGAPPMGRMNWNGTQVTETVGPLMCNDTTQFVAGWNGFANPNDSTFTIGQAADNKFYDYHWYGQNGYSLRPGVNTATATAAQTYRCSAAKSYNFTITARHDRLGAGTANERVFVTISK